MSNAAMPTIERLHELLRLDPETGRIFWKTKRRGPVKPGAEAFTSTASNGSRLGAIDYKNIQRARVIYAMHHGSWPAGEIRHLNGDNADDRPGNLADALTDPTGSARTWTCNGSARTSRYLGVSRNGNGWTAKRQVGGVTRYLGTYATEEQAARAYDEFGTDTDYANRRALRSLPDEAA